MHWKIYLCTEKYICALGNLFVHWKTYLCTEKYICALKNIFVHWKIYLCTGKLICALENIFVHWKIYFYSGKLTCALKNIFVHWKIYLCTGKYIFTLGNLLVHWKTYLCTENIYLCTQKHVRNVFRSIYMHWNFYLCIAYMGHRTLRHTTCWFGSFGVLKLTSTTFELSITISTEIYLPWSSEVIFSMFTSSRGLKGIITPLLWDDPWLHISPYQLDISLVRIAHSWDIKLNTRT